MKKNIFYGSPNKLMKFMLRENTIASIYHIANTIFMLEKKIKNNEKIPNPIKINLYVKISEKEKEKICKLLNNLILDVLYHNSNFVLEEKELKVTKPFENKEVKSSVICLFSGGIDSTTGILLSKNIFPDVVGAFIAHQDMTRTTELIKKINKNILSKKEIMLKKYLAPAMGLGYSQTRGFLYLLYGGISAHLHSANKIIISECGATMYQPKFSPLDTITYTTHPTVLQTAKKIIEIILKKNIQVITPFENLTKTEVMQITPQEDLFSNTHSCITSRWGKNCGKCYACLTRMIGSVNINGELDYFKENIFEMPNNENLSAFLRFCYDYILNQDEVDYWSLRTIKYYHKEDLFKRVCFDAFLALRKLKSMNCLDSSYEQILNDFEEKKSSELDIRLKELKKISIPNFNKKVISIE
ncbi:7-cyano-7-deazaguanine synthase [Patescibacteria group bacterium]|nr:7-cyano-7-deazaguanine synthase [Patescibacteria group bacterium]